MLQSVVESCNVLTRVAACWCVLQCVAVNVLQTPGSLAAAICGDAYGIVLQCLAMCDSVCCSVLQCVAVMRGEAHGIVMQCVARCVCCTVLQSMLPCVCCSMFLCVLQYVAVCVLQCV